MLIKIDDYVLNTDKITKIFVDPDGKFVVVYFSQDDYERFSFPHRDSQESFLRRIGLENYFA
ncbi:MULTISPECIES: hypothetical protein [Acinetobacter]|jgi:hypothetical protein|uniref:hypothetical protein n=1 Tax=Acinetobacter TaxID=469 RepID=UPI000EC0A054|nr:MULTISPECIES: hypothetical protein [Acinetobacter]HAB43372.1 hypothetical protein [Acinetobacter sp.]